jgi:hypothetical protein
MTSAHTRGQYSGSRGTHHDFDLHGVVGIRLVDAEPRDVAKVRRQLGPIDKRLDRRPDITIRFVDRATIEPLTYVGLGEGGFNDDGFFALRGRGADAAKARIPFAEIGQFPEIVCERGLPAVPHLLTLINLTALCKGVLPLHATAFTRDSLGVLVTGWSKAGKTEALLACMSDGASYVGDEWVYLTKDGDMHGLPEPIRLWSWHLHQVPHLLAARPRRDRATLSAWHRASGVAAALAASRLPGAAIAAKGAPIIGRQAYLQVPPEELFGRSAVSLRGHVDALVLVENHELPETVIQAAGDLEVPRRMAASLATERAQFLQLYLQFRYARPREASTVVDGADEMETRLLADRLGHLPAVKVLHPYPCDIAVLGRAVMDGARQCASLGQAGAL